MVRVQVVCRNTTEEQVRRALRDFDKVDQLRPRAGHMLVELSADDPTDKILQACRQHAYAYLRLTAWEKGGGLEATSDATCVAGTEGQPLKPIAVTLKGERANLEHALFGSRTGLVIAHVTRRGGTFNITVTSHRIREFRIEAPMIVINDTFECAPQEWLTDLQTRIVTMDKFIPVVRSVLRKAECTFCSHCHYREISEGDDS